MEQLSFDFAKEPEPAATQDPAHAPAQVHARLEKRQKRVGTDMLTRITIAAHIVGNGSTGYQGP